MIRPSTMLVCFAGLVALLAATIEPVAVVAGAPVAGAPVAGAPDAVVAARIAPDRTAAATWQDPKPGTPPDRPFRHRDHVQRTWFVVKDGTWEFTEVERDCRGCHVFTADGALDPQTRCHLCHVRDDGPKGNRSTFAVKILEGWESFDRLRDPNRSFRHHQHDKLACRECHGTEGVGYAPDMMPIPSGFGECARCHAEGGQTKFDLLRDAEVAPRAALENFLGKLNSDEAMRPDKLGPFLHRDHLPDTGKSWSLVDLLGADVATDPKCTSCHPTGTGIDNLHGSRFATDGCGKCHVGKQADGAIVPLQFEDRIEDGTSRAALTFSHAQHLRGGELQPDVASAEGYDRIAQRGCQACHVYDEAANTFVFKDAANTHEGCVSCHTSPKWVPGKHGNWLEQGCTSCHTFQGESLKTDRPTASVDRLRSSDFRVKTQRHPHITGGAPTTGVIEESCERCHRVRPRDLPSRIEDVAFRHRTHLPSEPGAADCLTCHGPRVLGARSPEEIGKFLNGRALDESRSADVAQLHAVYDANQCGTCHKGSLPVPANRAVQSREMPLFSHADHVGKALPAGSPLADAQLACTTCHTYDAAADKTGWKAGVRDCSTCHDHSTPWREQISGQIDAGGVQTCYSCHLRAVPSSDRPLPVRRKRAIAMAGTLGQHHDPDNTDCSQCHVGVKSVDLRTGGNHVFARGGLDTDVHREIPDGSTLFLKGEEGVLCYWCHWRNVSGYALESKDSRLQLGRIKAGEYEFPGGPYRARDRDWGKAR